MRYFSMFSGIGGFEKGINQAGLQAECIGYSEIDKYAIKVYERHFGNESIRCLQSQGNEVKQAGDNDTNELQQRQQPNSTRGHRNYGDATRIDPTDLPDFDLLVGGFPCQAFSIAGKRAGFDDTRGTLFFEIARILKEKRPRHLVLENVKGLLSHDSGRTFTTIIGVLTDLGYLVEWQVLNSKDFGVPQNRERVYIVGHLGGDSRRKVFPIGGSSSKNNRIIKVHDTGHDGNTVYSSEGLAVTQKALGGGQGGKGGIYEVDKPRVRRLTPVECERLQGFPDNWTKYGINDEPISDTQRYKMCGNAVTVNTVEAVMRGLLPCL